MMRDWLRMSSSAVASRKNSGLKTTRSFVNSNRLFHRSVEPGGTVLLMTAMRRGLAGLGIDARLFSVSSTIETSAAPPSYIGVGRQTKKIPENDDDASQSWTNSVSVAAGIGSFQ